MKRIFTAVVAVSWSLAGGALADPPTATVPIEPTSTPIIVVPHATPPIVAPMPDARSLSQINPTAGPAVPAKAALKPTRKATVHAIAKTTATGQQHETVALNLLAAAGYGQFHDLHRVGRNYQATVDDPHGSYVVTVDPDSGRITPPSAAADRETRALNLLANRGYIEVNAIRPAGAGFVATITQDDGPHQVAVDPDSGSITRGD